MPTARECLCCKEVDEVSAVMQEFPDISCVTDHPGFQPVCLDVNVLRTAYYSYRQHYNEEIENLPEYVIFLTFLQHFLVILFNLENKLVIMKSTVVPGGTYSFFVLGGSS